MAPMIIAQTISDRVSNCLHLIQLVEPITTSLQVVPERVSAAAGCCTESNLAALETRKIDTQIAAGRSHGPTARQARAPGLPARPAGPANRAAKMAAKLCRAGRQGPLSTPPVPPRTRFSAHTAIEAKLAAHREPTVHASLTDP